MGIEAAALESIQVPALICVSWSDHGLHTRGSIAAFERISSRQKWLFTHGRKKWETFYSEEALAWQQRFLDHFLKDIDNGIDQLPKVRLEIRRAFYQQQTRSEDGWPLSSVRPVRLYLCATTGTLRLEPVSSEAKMQYQSRGRNGKAAFSCRFEQPTELIGSMRLKLWVSTSEGDDLDLFVMVKKLDAAGREVFFSGFNGFEKDGVAKGWLRVSHRELNESRSTPLRPWHNHTSTQKLHPGVIVPVEIEIWPSATLFEAGTSLQLTIQGHDAAKFPALAHRQVVNRGTHTIFAGGQYDSFLKRYLLTHDDDFWNDRNFPLKTCPGLILLATQDTEIGEYVVVFLRKLICDYNPLQEALFLDQVKIRMTKEGVTIKMVDRDTQTVTAQTWAWNEFY